MFWKKLSALMLSTFLLFGVGAPLCAYAFGDDLGTKTTDNGSGDGYTTDSPQAEEQEPIIPKEPLDEGTQSMSDFLQGYQPVTSDQMAEGQKIATPIAKFIGKIITIGLALLTVWLFLQTVIDMIYILIPATQPNLSGSVQVQGKVSRCWVTTEALQAAGSATPQGARGGMGMGMRGGMGYGGGMGMRGGMGMGPGMGMGGAGGMQQQRQQTSSNMLLSYFKSRTVTLVVFGICIILLFSNIFLDFGTILGEWIYSIFTYIGNMLRG